MLGCINDLVKECWIVAVLEVYRVGVLRCRVPLVHGSCGLGMLGSTGFFVLQNALLLFCTETLDRRKYWAELAEILHGPP